MNNNLYTGIGYLMVHNCRIMYSKIILYNRRIIMGLMEAIIFACFSFTALVCATMALVKGKSILEVILGVCTSLLSIISAYNFHRALIDSGKNPAFLGFYRYPVVFPVYCLFTTAGIALMLHGVIQQIGNKKVTTK